MLIGTFIVSLNKSSKPPTRFSFKFNIVLSSPRMWPGLGGPGKHDVLPRPGVTVQGDGAGEYCFNSIMITCSLPSATRAPRPPHLSFSSNIFLIIANIFVCSSDCEVLIAGATAAPYIGTIRTSPGPCSYRILSRALLTCNTSNKSIFLFIVKT